MKLKYRPEVDGLRAIAVLSVILYHADFELFSGGFVGVDVFFVISGYLITSIIFVELQEDKFSLLNFFERRIRRIFGAICRDAVVLDIRVALVFAERLQDVRSNPSCRVNVCIKHTVLARIWIF